MVPELFMSVYLKNNNVAVREIFGFRIHILRMNGEKFSINSDKYFEDNSPLCFYKPSIEKCIGVFPSGFAREVRSAPSVRQGCTAAKRDA